MPNNTEDKKGVVDRIPGKLRAFVGTFKRSKKQLAPVGFASIKFELMPSTNLEEFAQKRIAKNLDDLKKLIPIIVQEFGERMVCHYMSHNIPDYATFSLVFSDKAALDTKTLMISLTALKEQIDCLPVSSLKKLPNYLKSEFDYFLKGREALDCLSIKNLLSKIAQNIFSELNTLFNDSPAQVDVENSEIAKVLADDAVTDPSVRDHIYEYIDESNENDGYEKVVEVLGTSGDSRFVEVKDKNDALFSKANPNNFFGLDSSDAVKAKGPHVSRSGYEPMKREKLSL